MVRLLAGPNAKYKFGLWRYAAVIIRGEVYYVFIVSREAGPIYHCRFRSGEGAWILEHYLMRIR